MITITNLSKAYPNNPSPVFQHVNLTFENTGMYYLIGKSGAGKSTLLNIIGAMDDNYQGSVKVNSQEIKEMTEAEKADYRLYQIAFLFQSYKADEHESVHQNLLKALAITDLSEKEKEQRIQKRLRQVGLSEKEKEPFKNLSGGEKKRISLVRALIKESPILLADEPLSSLNSHLRKEITDILHEESKKRCVIIITHEKEEIPIDATVAELSDGNIVLQQIGKSSSAVTHINYKRKPFHGKALFSQLIHTLIRQKDLLIITMFSLIIGLFAISFSFQLSSSVSQAMTSSLSNYMEENSLVVTYQDEGYVATGFETADYQELNLLARNYPDYIQAVSSFYLDSLDAIFGDNQKISINLNQSSVNLPKISLDSFLEYRMPFEVMDRTIYGQQDIDEDEVILALDQDSMAALFVLVFDYKASALNEETMTKLANQVFFNNVYLRIKANQGEWSYQQDYSLKVKGLILDDSCYLVHPSSLFSNHFVTDIMHFKEVLEEESVDPTKPWSLHKCEGFRLSLNQTGEFLKVFLQDRTCMDYTLKMIKTQNYYLDNDLLTHNHVALIHDFLPKVKLPEIQDFVSAEKNNIESLAFSSPVYTYTASGYISGFAKPFFFSKYKDKLNTIEDNSYTSDQDLGSFQGSLIEDIPGVIKADLISAMNQKTGLNYVPLDHTKLVPSYGKTPENYSEIGISKGLAKKLFNTASEAVGKELYTLTLDETTQDNGIYYNHFSSGELIITGIYENDGLALYHDSLFPLAYCFAHAGLDPSENRIQQAILKVNLDNHDADYYLNRIKDYGDYSGSFPMLVMIDEIKETLNQLAELFFGFAILSLISASTLLILSLYLIISKDRKEIGILLSLGYQKKEISRFYLCFSLFLGLLCYVGSLFISIFAQKTLQDTLSSMIQETSYSLIPFLISFLTSFILTLVIGLVIRIKIKRISPMDAFERSRE